MSHSALSAADRERDREHGSALALSGSASLPSLSLSGSTKPRRTSLTALRAEDDLSEDEDEAVVRVPAAAVGCHEALTCAGQTLTHYLHVCMGAYAVIQWPCRPFVHML